MQHLATYGLELSRHGKGQDAGPVFQAIDEIRNKVLTDLPQMIWLKNFTDVHRSEYVIWKGRNGREAEAKSDMAMLVKRADPRTKQTMEYNSACLYARLAESGPAAEREGHAA